jgi:urocanate hydratase
MSFSGAVLEYQPRLYLTYAQLHACARNHGSYQREAALGGFAGCFIAAFGLGEAAEVLPLAAAISGACFLGVDPDGERLKGLLRAGRCDFVVNSLDEALRILKNELRQRKPVSVVLKGDTASVVVEIEDRGVSPNLVVETEDAAAEAKAVSPGSRACLLEEDVPLVEETEDGGATRKNSEAMVVSWTLPSGTAAMLARLDALALPVLPERDGMRRRWLQAAGRYIPRQSPPGRASAWTRREFERLMDIFSARLMTGELQGPLVVETPEESFTLGG